MSGKIAEALQPAKFMLLVVQVVALSVVLKTQDQYIYTGILPSLSKDSEQYKAAAYSLSVWIGFSILALIVEFVIIFSGVTLFNDKYNLCVIGAHIVGLSVTCAYLAGPWHYLSTFWLFIAGCAFPLAFELTSYGYSKMNYRANGYLV